MKIHPTAIVDPEAQLGPGTEVGPWVMIGPQVRLGANCVVQARSTLEGDLQAGDNNTFGYGSVIGAPPQDFAYRAEDRTGVRIGNNNTFREYTTIHRGTKPETDTVVGDDCYLMVESHLGHNSKLGNRVIMANGSMLGGYVEIGDGAVIGGGAIFHQFMRVGHGALVRGGGRFSKDIPPFTIGDTDNAVSGINVVGMRRGNISPPVRTELRRAFRLLFLSGLNVTQALEQANETDWGSEAQAFFDFIRISQRGICCYSGLVNE